MKEIDLVIFDLAGTTMKDRGQVSNAFTSALAEHGLEVTPDQLSVVRGSSKRQAVLQFIPDSLDRAQRAAAVYQTFREHLARRYRLEGIEPIDGAERTFRWLKERGVGVALNTGFDRDMTTLLLDALRWGDGVADAVVCGDDVSEGRPAPYMIFRAMEAANAVSVHRIANVGDTTLDLHAGHHAGARWNIGVLTGAHDRHRLTHAPHTHLVLSVAELPDLFGGVC